MPANAQRSEADRTLTDWYGGELSVKSLVRLLEERLREHPGAENLEVMCHPGFTALQTGQGVSRVGAESESGLGPDAGRLRIDCNAPAANAEFAFSGGYRINGIGGRDSE
jgi:hypothetical protein